MADEGRRRWTARPLPPYRHRPGRTPHPERDPRGYRYGAPEPTPPPLDAERFEASEEFLYGVDLFNLGYPWEAHAVWEALWRASSSDAVVAELLRGLIQLAAARVQLEAGRPGGARKLLRRAAERLRRVEAATGGRRVAGLDPGRLAEAIEAGLADEPPRVELVLTPEP